MVSNYSLDSGRDVVWILASNMVLPLNNESKQSLVLIAFNWREVHDDGKKQLEIWISLLESNQSIMKRLQMRSWPCKVLLMSKEQEIRKLASSLKPVSSKMVFPWVTSMPMFLKPLAEMITNNWKVLVPSMHKFDWSLQRCLHLHSPTLQEARSTTLRCVNAQSIVACV